LSNVKLEFFEPPAVSWFWRGRGFLHTCPRQDEHDELPAARRSDREVHGRPVETQGGERPVHLYASNYPQYELVIDNDIAMQKRGVDRDPDGEPICRRRQHLGARLQSSSASSSRSMSRPRRSSGGTPGISQIIVRQERCVGEWSLTSSFTADQEEAGHERDQPLQPVSLRRHSRSPAAGYSSGQAIQADPGGRRRDAASRLRHRLGRPIL